MIWRAASARPYLNHLRQAALRELPPQRGGLVGARRIRAIRHVRRGDDATRSQRHRDVGAQIDTDSKAWR